MRCLLRLRRIKWNGHLARVAPPLARWWFAGRSLGLDGRLWRLAALRTPIAPLGHSLRCVGGGRRVLSCRRSSVAFGRASLTPSSAPPSYRCGVCGRARAASAFGDFKRGCPPTPPLRPFLRVAVDRSEAPSGIHAPSTKSAPFGRGGQVRPPVWQSVPGGSCLAICLPRLRSASPSTHCQPSGLRKRQRICQECASGTSLEKSNRVGSRKLRAPLPRRVPVVPPCTPRSSPPCRLRLLMA